MNHLFCHLIQFSVLPLIWPRGVFGLPWTKARKWRSFFMAPREWWAHVNYHYHIIMIHDDVFISREYSGRFDLPLLQYPCCPFGSHLIWIVVLRRRQLWNLVRGLRDRLRSCEYSPKIRADLSDFCFKSKNCNYCVDVKCVGHTGQWSWFPTGLLIRWSDWGPGQVRSWDFVFLDCSSYSECQPGNHEMYDSLVLIWLSLSQAEVTSIVFT